MKKMLMVGSLALTVAAGAFAQQGGIKGYLVDALCGKAGYPEGYQGKIDLSVNPEKNVVACLTMGNCVASGFGISVKGSNGKYVFHTFDKASSDLVKRLIVDKLKNKADPAPFMQIDGTVSSAGAIFGVSKATVVKAAAGTSGDSKGSAMSTHNM